MAQVNRFSLRPFGDYLRATQQRASMTDQPEPLMFASGTGDLPAFCASGIDVELLRWAHWSVRHTAAQTTDPGLVYRIIEESAADTDPYALQTADGRRALADYSTRVFRWATAPALSDTGMTTEQYAQLWGTG